MSHAVVQAADPVSTQCVTIQVDPAAEFIATVIPYRNPAALVGYYLAVFSFIPIAGLALGPLAVLLGIFGVYRSFKRGARARGSLHALFAVGAGGLTSLFNCGLFLVAAAGR